MRPAKLWSGGLLAVCMTAAGAAAQPVDVVINEAFSGTPDFIEIRNCGPAPVDLSGWTVATWYGLSGGAVTAETPYTLPAGSIIPANGFLVLQEFGATGQPGSLPNSISVGFNYFWVANRTLEVALLDPAGGGVDYVYKNVFNHPPAPNLPAPTPWTGSITNGTGDVLHRVIDIDTHDASDWTVTGTPHSAAALNPNQQGGPCGGGVVGPQHYQVNSPEASIDIDGLTTTGWLPAVTQITSPAQGMLTVSSSLIGNGFDLAVTLEGVIPRTSPFALETPNGQVANVNLFSPSLFFFNSGTFYPVLQPFPAAVTVPVTAPVPVTLSTQMVIADQTDPDGFSLSQASQLDVVLDNQLGPAQPCLGLGSPVTLSDDSFSQQPLGFSYNFYGTSYTEIFVGSNGHCTFSAGHTGWATSASSLNSGQPRVAICSEDFNPGAGGTVTFFADGASQYFQVCWTGVPSFGATNTNDFVLDGQNGSAFGNGLISFNYGPTFQETDGTVGLSAGNNINNVLPLNLSAAGGLNGPIPIPPNSTPVEDFQGTFDLVGSQVNFDVDPSGVPITVF